MPDQKQREPDSSAWPPSAPGDRGAGPKEPDVKKPDTESILKKLKRIAPDQAKRYRQRAGE